MPTAKTTPADDTSAQLLALVKAGFEQIDSRLTRVEDKLAGVDRRLSGVEGRLILLEQNVVDHGVRLSRVEEHLTTLTTSVDRFAKIFTDLNQEVVVLRQQLRDAEQRIDKLELRLHAA